MALRAAAPDAKAFSVSIGFQQEENIMSLLTIRAHFDGEHVLLDEPYQLEPDAQLLILVLPKQLQNGEHEDWARLSLQALGNAYGAHEPEYSLSRSREV